MFKTKDGFEFDTEEKVKDYESGANVCFGGCRSLDDPCDKACANCLISKECVALFADND